MAKFLKQESHIKKGERYGQPVVPNGARIRALGLPVKASGGQNLTGSSISFEGTIDGLAWCTVNDYLGNPLTLPTVAAQTIDPVGSGLKAAPAYLPLRAPELFEGFTAIRPVTDRPQAMDQVIVFYHE